MKVLFCGLKHEYGNPQRGVSFEYVNLYDSMSKMSGVEASYFAVDELMAESGRDEMNRLLIKRVEEEKPDLLFCFLFTEEIKKETIVYITQKTKTKTFNWFGDDHWRFPVYSRHWAPLFTLVSTTDSQAYAAYKKLGINNVVKTQWAANHNLYKPVDRLQDSKIERLKDLDITFVGQNYGKRSAYINFLQKQQFPVKAFGWGWPNGGVDEQTKMEIFSFSKINLNFTETSDYGFKNKLKLLVRLFFKKERQKVKLNLGNPVDNFKSILGTQRRTIKGRNFEVPACGGFLLTGYSDENLEEYYEDGKEIVIFRNFPDLVDKCRYYLNNDSERIAIALAGYKRTIKEHTYERRFKEIFKIMELM